MMKSTKNTIHKCPKETTIDRVRLALESRDDSNLSYYEKNLIKHTHKLFSFKMDEGMYFTPFDDILSPTS